MGDGCLIFVGDVHLGRRPATAAEGLAACGLDPRDVSPAVAWRATVDEALASAARAVVLAGDVVESEVDRFEAFGALEAGVRRLTEAGVAVFGVAGNHDGLVLPRLAERIAGFTLLGAGGRWQVAPVPGAGGPVDLLGWSFPARHHRGDPLADASFEVAVSALRSGATALGVLHADLDAADSPYAPVRSADLARAPTAAWFLGHVHAPHDLGGDRPLGYLGSLCGLDAGEPGPRGPWRVDVTGGQVRATHLPLAPIRWCPLRVEANDAEDADALHAAVLRAARDAVDPEDDPRLRVRAWRVTLTGPVSDRAVVDDFLGLAGRAPLVIDAGGRPGFVERVIDATWPQVDLDALARERTPAGRLARRLRALEDGEPLPPTLDEAFARVSTPAWRPTPLAEAARRAAAVRACRRALDALLRQVR